MSIPLRQALKVGAYVLKQRLQGRKRYPLVLMLEPLFRCNLACAGCGKIQHPTAILRQNLSPEDCFRAAEECGAPVVSIAGGEPLLHPQIEEIAAGLVPAFTGLARHPSAEVRTFAVRFLSAQSQPEAKSALLQALGDRDEAVQRAVLSALERGAMDSVKPLIELFGREQNWSLRAAAASRNADHSFLSLATPSSSPVASAASMRAR